MQFSFQSLNAHSRCLISSQRTRRDSWGLRCEETNQTIQTEQDAEDPSPYPSTHPCISRASYRVVVKTQRRISISIRQREPPPVSESSLFLEQLAAWSCGTLWSAILSLEQDDWQRHLFHPPTSLWIISQRDIFPPPLLKGRASIPTAALRAFLHFALL